MDAHFDDLDRLYRIYRTQHAQLERDVDAARERVPTIWPRDVPIPVLTRAEFEMRVRALSSGNADIVLWLRGLICGVEEEFPSLLALLQKTFTVRDPAA